MTVDDTALRAVTVGSELGFLLRSVQVYAWLVFAAAWLQIGRGDWLHQKIRNSYLLYWGRFVLAAYPVLLLGTLMGRSGRITHFLYWAYYPALGVHLGFSLAAALTLWWLRVWPAGDAKLYCLLAAAYPLMTLPGDFHRGLRFFEVLSNIFLPAAGAVFAVSAAYVYRTRLRSQRLFLAQLGARRELDYFRDQSRELWESLKPVLARWLARAFSGGRRAGRSAKEKGLRAAAEGMRWGVEKLTHPTETAVGIFDWFLSMVLMSLATYYLGRVVQSSFLKAASMFLLFILWGRVQQRLGRAGALAVGTALFGVALYRTPEVDYGLLALSFANISVFTLAIRFGMNWTLRLIAGRMVLVFLSLAGLAAVPLLDYLIEPLLNLAVIPLLQFLVGLVPWGRLARFEWLAGPSAAAAAWSGAHARVTIDIVAPAADWLLSGTTLTWAALGLFFGLALVLARIRDLESFESVEAGRIAAQMMPGPALIEKLREDEEYFVEHFEPLYADGLTAEQAEALKEWCRERGVEAVPLAPTLSFASWIFVGYLLTVLLDGHVFQFLF